ncbi:hypothetical protein D3C81_1982530 [compost metagenome]
MHRQHVGLFEQGLFADEGHTGFGGAFGGQVFAPGDHPHAEYLAKPGNPLTNAAQPQYRQGLAVQVAPKALLPFSGA